ncbi:thiamine-phosphate kinase [Chondrinema litorale]|uniref:thiamine-phosphate kinase n=1 Tax=Chondrinema litorale TaxID=2994555 RepID=UPI0025446C30|nr:thiamine-phosphate kinase [Chondrinema litorale]UZR95065.1 thiamine-phosphate kinase [Chondrinema litorale]
MKRTELNALGEFGLIKEIQDNAKLHHSETLKGIGDDAAVIEAGDHVKVVTTDMLVEGVHFDLSYVPLKHLGYKSVVVNISDIAAMNAIPKQITMSVAISNRFSKEAIDEFYEGVFTACEQYKVDLIGGDTTSSRSGFVISVTAIGEAKKEEVVYRNTAKDKDIICATGDLGGAYVGLQVLEREKQEFLSNPNMQPQLDRFEYVVMRQLKPEARMDLIHEFRELGIVPTSMIDISDGLASEILHITRSSGVGAVLFEDKLPIEKQMLETLTSEFENLSASTCVLNGGEDYELLFTISQEDYEKIKTHKDISFIGYIDSNMKGVKLKTRAEQIIDVEAQGWVHFRDSL